MKKKLLLITLLILAIGVVLSTTVQAGYQSIPTGTATQKTATNWITGIREIESSSGGMGLSESINTTTLMATTSANNVDVHLQRNTEYGAAVILSASNYGKQGNGAQGSNYVNSSTYGLATSTGNRYGIYELGQQGAYEWVAGGGSGFISNSINARYIDRYTTSETSYKKGDATFETKGWHGSGYSWFSGTSVGFRRGNLSAFYYNYSGATNSRCGRACVVSGAGF